MTNTQCKDFSKAYLVDKAYRKLHITKSNAAEMHKDAICAALNTCGKRGLVFPNAEFRMEVKKTEGIVYLLPRDSPLSYRDYEILVKGEPASKIRSIATNKLKIDGVKGQNKISFVQSMIMNKLRAMGVHLDPIKIKVTKTNTNRVTLNNNLNRTTPNNGNLNLNNNLNRTTPNNNNNGNLNNNNKNLNNNNKNLNNNNKNNKNLNNNLSRTTPNKNLIRATPNNNRNLKLKATNTHNVSILKASSSGTNLPIIRAQVNTRVNNQPKAKLSISNLGQSVQVGSNLSLKKGVSLLKGAIPTVIQNKIFGNSLNTILSKQYGLTDSRMKADFIKSVTNTNMQNIRSISDISANDQKAIAKKLALKTDKKGKLPTSNLEAKNNNAKLAAQLINVIKNINTAAELNKKTINFYTNKFPLVNYPNTNREKQRRVVAVKKALRKLIFSEKREAPAAVVPITPEQPGGGTPVVQTPPSESTNNKKQTPPSETNNHTKQTPPSTLDPAALELFETIKKL